MFYPASNITLCLTYAVGNLTGRVSGRYSFIPLTCLNSYPVLVALAYFFKEQSSFVAENVVIPTFLLSR